MTPTEIRVAQIMSRHGSRLSLHEFSPDTAMAQDAIIDGIDVDDLVFDLEDEFGLVIREIPWLRFSDQRASFRGCGIVLYPAWVVWRLFVRKSDEPIHILPDPQLFPRLTVSHIAGVIDRGEWFEPDTRYAD
ncbi:MAG: hypothetical protein FJ335_07135 [Sphingomonadales bacterium]|nr:hypothetical protein [Sphingomonadales bacterium]